MFYGERPHNENNSEIYITSNLTHLIKKRQYFIQRMVICFSKNCSDLLTEKTIVPVISKNFFSITRIIYLTRNSQQKEACARLSYFTKVVDTKGTIYGDKNLNLSRQQFFLL